MRTPEYFQADTGKHDRWLVSYVDILTILLVLFVAVAAHGIQQPVTKHDPLTDTKEKLQRQGVDLEVASRGLVISVPQAVLFATGEDHVSSTALPMISGIAD